MDVIGAKLCFYDFDLLPFAQLPQYFSYVYLQFPIDDLPSVFGRKYDMVLAIPLRMR